MSDLFVKNIQNWITLDNNIKRINKGLREIKNKKNVFKDYCYKQKTLKIILQLLRRPKKGRWQSKN